MEKLYGAIATLTGCIIGAGVLGIPYVMVRAGFWTGMLVLVVLGLAYLLIHLMVGEISLRTKSCHQLVGYVEKYVGKKGKWLMTASMVIGVYGALVAYTLGVSESLMAMFGGSQLFWMVVFYVIMAGLIFGGLEVLEKSEIGMEVFKFVIFIVILIVLFMSPRFSVERLVGFSWWNVMLPYGVILFAFTGTAAIPEMRQVLLKCPHYTKKAIVLGTLIPLVVYAFFAAAVIGVSGFQTTEVATIGVAQQVGLVGFVLLHIFGILAMASSFVALGYAMKDMYRFDFRLSHSESWALTMTVPAILLLVGVSSFVRTLELAGVFAGGTAGLAIMLAHANSKKKSERRPEFQLKGGWLLYGVLSAIFILGMLYELFLFL